MRSQGRPTRAAAILAVLALVALECSRSGETPKPRRRAPHKVFLIGFDGMDPTLARRWMAEGKLPNLSQLAREGAFSPLQTTQPSPRRASRRVGAGACSASAVRATSATRSRSWSR